MRPCACPQSLEHVVKELHDSFEGVLVTAGNQLHILRCAARPPKHHQHDDGCHEHEFDNHSK